ncbi:MAG: hypothetical protein GY946_08335, partial [bacterium]|nr:hypothetical protein [bacterium]
HYTRSGHVGEAVAYLRKAGHKALDRYALSEADQQYRAAYELLTAEGAVRDAIDEGERDRLLLNTLLEWSEIFYYAGDMPEIHQLYLRHQELPDAVGDRALKSRWKGWEGMIMWLHTGEITRPTVLLEEALVLAEECGDAVGRALALAWLIWTRWQGGECGAALRAWSDLEALLPSVPDAGVRQYAAIKGKGGAAVAAAMSGDMSVAENWVDDLLEVGHTTGNRRATAMGHMMLAVARSTRGDVELAESAGRRAVEASADPVYSIT